MKGLKTLSTLFLVFLALSFVSGAAAQSAPEPDIEINKDVDASAYNGERIAYTEGTTLTVTDLDGSAIYTTQISESAYSIDFDPSNNVFVGGSNGLTMAYDAQGEKLWDFQWEDQGGYGVQLYGIDADSDHVAVASKDNFGGLLDKQGNKLARGGTNGNSNAIQVAKDTDGFYVADNKDDLFKFDASGNLVWQESLGGYVRDITQLEDGTLFAAVGNGQISEVTPEGSVDQTITASSDGIRAIDADNAVIAGTTEGVLKKYETDLSSVWSSDVGNSSHFNNIDVVGDSFMADNDQIRLYNTFQMPESTTVTDESTALTGSFALSTSAATFTALKGISGAAAGIGIWEFSIRDWLFGTNDADQELWKGDIRANAVTLEDQRKNLLNASQLAEDALFGDAMAQGKSQGLQAFNNGSTREETKDAVQSTIEDYYSDVERTVVNGYNNEVLNLQNDMDNAESAEADFSGVFKRDFEDLAIVNTTYQLPNGDEIPTYNVIDDSGARIMTLESGNGAGLVTTSGDNYDSAVYLNGSAHYEVIQGARDTRSNAITNVNDIVDNIYDNYQQGDINISDELSALELTSALSTSYSETGSYNYAAASLARTGQPTDLDSAFTISYSNESFEGALFASEAVVGTEVEPNTTYNGADGNAVFVAQGDDSAELIELDSEFTVESIKSLDTGESLNATELQESTVYTQNTTDLAAQIQSLEEEFKNTQSSGGFVGGGGLEDSPLAGLVVVLLLILVGAILV